LQPLPEIARALTLPSFVPDDQHEKLAIIDDNANIFLRNTLNPDQVEKEPTPDETLAAIGQTAQDLRGAAGDLDTPAAKEARRLASLLGDLAKAPPAARDEAQRVLIAPPLTTLQQVRDLLTAEPVSLETLPASLRSDWISAGGEARIEVAPRGGWQ